MSPDRADPDAVGLFALRVWQYKQGELVSLMIHLGDRLGLYRAMDGAGPVTPEDLAGLTGLHERWVREWLRSQAAAGLLVTDDQAEYFELSPEGAEGPWPGRPAAWPSPPALSAGARRRRTWWTASSRPSGPAAA